METVSNTCYDTISGIHKNFENLVTFGSSKPKTEVAVSKGKMSFGVNNSENLNALRQELEEKEEIANQLRNQYSESEAEAKEKLEAFKQEIDNQEDKIKACNFCQFSFILDEEENKLDEELENLVANYNETVKLYEQCNEEAWYQNIQ